MAPKPHPLLEEAVRFTNEARGIMDEYKTEADMPADVADHVDGLLTKAQQNRRRVNQETQAAELNAWIGEPDYRHDMLDPGTKTLGVSDDGDEDDYPTKKAEEQRKRLQHKGAFFKWLRSQSPSYQGEGLNLEEKKLVEDATGQILVPEDITDVIFKDLPNEGIVRPLVTVRPTGRDRIKVRSLGLVTMGWAKVETEPSPGGTQFSDVESTPTPAEDEIKVHNLIGLSKIGEDELDDNDVNLESLVREVFTLEAAEQEDLAFVDGNGSARPLGILQDTSVTAVNSEGGHRAGDAPRDPGVVRAGRCNRLREAG